MNRTLERTMSLSQRHRHTPSPFHIRSVSRTAYSNRDFSRSNLSRMSLDSDLKPKRRDSIDDIAKALNEIE